MSAFLKVVTNTLLRYMNNTMNLESSLGANEKPEVDLANGFLLCNTFFPQEIITYILSFVPLQDLKSCRLVCQLWKTLIDSEACYQKFNRDYKTLFSSSFVNPIEKIAFNSIPFYLYFAISKNAFGTNLLENVFGSGNDPHECLLKYVDNRFANDADPYDMSLVCSSADKCPKFKHWRIKVSRGDGWRVESTPHGSDPLPEELKGRSCFATSYQRCEKDQLINLIEHGFTSKILDEVKPHFEISEWYAARFDCGSIYHMKVSLLDDHKRTISVFRIEKSTEQWKGRHWDKVCHTLTDYDPGVRYILFEHGGRDTQLWAGHYGSKMAGASVVAKIPSSFLEQTSESS